MTSQETHEEGSIFMLIVNVFIIGSCIMSDDINNVMRIIGTIYIIFKYPWLVILLAPLYQIIENQNKIINYSFKWQYQNLPSDCAIDINGLRGKIAIYREVPNICSPKFHPTSKKARNPMLGDLCFIFCI